MCGALSLPDTSGKECFMDNTIWIIIVVLIVLAVLGYFGRGRFRG
jgi:flagellar basal body-associated protein FliL